MSLCPWEIMPGTNARRPCATPRQFTRTTQVHSSGVNSQVTPGSVTPALLQAHARCRIAPLPSRASAATDSYNRRPDAILDGQLDPRSSLPCL